MCPSSADPDLNHETSQHVYIILVNSFNKKKLVKIINQVHETCVNKSLTNK